VIDLHDIKEIVSNLKGLVELKTKHSYLQKYMEAPSVDEDKILLLYSIYEDLLLPKEQSEHYILTTMLVQLALDTHESVPNRLTYSDESMRSEQLSVLAGDYFSGLYYYLLAQSSDITFIRTLAEGIKEVNEAKIHLYQIDHTEISKLFSYLELVESAVFQKIVNSFQIKKWDELVPPFLLLKRLLNEREMYVRDGSSIVFDSLKKALSQRDKQDQEEIILLEFNNYLSIVSKLLEKVLATNPKINHILLNRMNELLHKGNSLTMNKIVEEG
jgi:heptaprenyl diphosphate synthase